MDEPLIPTVKTLNLKYRVGGITRKFFRHLFEHKKVRALLGTNLAIMLAVSSFMPNYTLGNNSEVDSIAMVDGTETPIKTEISIQYPVSKLKINQGFKFYHPGIDLDGETGDTIKPIKKGKITSVDYSKFAYGNSVIVDHGANITSLYAHLSKIDVKEGQEVTTDTKLGEMGSTGRSTGSHLHLEVRDHGIPINPLSVLPK
ncbi:MAG TPA: M23 family metallopeptidase [Patescibacteria group bacterium]|nr:M23 family metallopeptidase [Patescibacteria group bacterium]